MGRPLHRLDVARRGLSERRESKGRQLAAGCVSGIGAGLAMPWLGEIGRMLERFATPAVIGLAVLDIALVIL